MNDDRFEDHRGVIQDLITRRIDAITEITTKAGAVRGNHVHEHTVQYTYVVSGRMKFVAQPGCTPESRTEQIAGPGRMITEHPGVPHAWQAIEDTVVLVFTRGPRSGPEYESDTKRLEIPIL
jgi:quercetin dioxygenase-like cupin family protein